MALPDSRHPRRTRAGRLRLAVVLGTARLLAACGGGGPAPPELDLGAGITMTVDGAIVIREEAREGGSRP